MEGDDEKTGDEPVASTSETPVSLTEAQRERIKLGAAYLNGIAIGLFVVGGVSLPGTVMLGGSDLRDFTAAFLISAFFISVNPYIHRRAKQNLEDLDR